VTGLTFYGGVNEIGGNKILLEDKDTRVFLDFGKSFSRRSKFFEEYINPRVSNGIEDYLTMGLLPNVQGVYRDDLMKMAQRHATDPNIDAVLLTHAHSDHADMPSCTASVLASTKTNERSPTSACTFRISTVFDSSVLSLTDITY
jgi:ribonuclease J